MSILDKLKGFIKLSEVSTDDAQPLFDTQVREDANTVLTQSSLVLEDTLRKQSIVVLSTGLVTWSLNKLTPDANTNIVVKFLQNQSGQVTNLVLNYADFFAGLSFANDGDILYIELDRSKVVGSSVVIYNGGPNIGQRALVASSLPAMTNSQTASFQGTICIPIAVRQGTNLWWNPSGFYWPTGTNGIIGSIGTTDPIPTGMILSFAGQEADTPSGYLFCDGSLKSAALYPALASIYWTGTGYLYGGSGFTPGPSPNGNFNLPDLRGLFVKGAGAHGSLINGKQYSATLAAKDSDRTSPNDISVSDVASHRHNHFDDNLNGLIYSDSGERGDDYHPWSGEKLLDVKEGGAHTHTISTPDQQTYPAHMGLNYIVKA